MTAAAVRAELKAKLATVVPRSFGFAPDSLQPPTAFVGTVTRNPRAGFDEADMTAEVWVAVSGSASGERAVEALDAYVDGTGNIPDTLEATSAAWDSLAVVNIEWPVTVAIGAGEYPAVRFDCELFL